jgi:hypothetical protein
VVLTVSGGGQAATATGTATAKSITGRWSEDTGAIISLTQKGSVFDGYDNSPFRAWSPIPVMVGRDKTGAPSISISRPIPRSRR